MAKKPRNNIVHPMPKQFKKPRNCFVHPMAAKKKLQPFFHQYFVNPFKKLRNNLMPKHFKKPRNPFFVHAMAIQIKNLGNNFVHPIPKKFKKILQIFFYQFFVHMARKFKKPKNNVMPYIKRIKLYGLCSNCKRPNSGFAWCGECDPGRFLRKGKTSGNPTMD
ncbi:12994_t:CDS:1, partial [Funneliformis geosporum]